ncbi:MATE family efflux transporter [Erysipelothrix urinaevulpis]|uniref:MATE family efflux transporter n=1 Tax=Erysipelothrix urinaevulpis TaxID=2683717 RepID=UPI00135A560B|nr:MATE family efflux transporter [Erysipelothrix urinaevulpis]
MTVLNQKNVKFEFFKLAIPSVISMWVYTLYTMVDGMFVAKGVGETALAAVNISMPLINIAFGISILWAVGASTRASIFKGKNDKENANRVFTISTITVFVLGLIFTFVTFTNLDFFAKLLGSSPETHHYVKDYLSVIVLFFPFYMTAYNLEVLIKADGFPKKAVTAVLTGAFTNIILDYLFVIRFGYGIKGAAAATGLSQLITFGIFFSHYLINKNGFTFIKVKLRLSEILSMAKIGIADSLTESSVASITFLFNHVLLTNIGNDGIVIHTVITYVYQLVLMTMLGLNQGMQPLVSYYYGKEDSKSYKYILRVALISAGIASLIAFLIAMILPAPIISMFISPDNLDLFNHAIYAFRLFAFSYLPLGFVIIFYGYFTATESINRAISISLARGLIFVLISLAIMPKLFGEPGIWLSLLLSESLSLIFALTLFKQAKVSETVHQYENQWSQ